MDSVRRQRLANGLLLVVSTVLALGLCEVVVRVYAAVQRPARIEDLARQRPLPPPNARISLGELIEPSPYPRLVFELRPSLQVIFPNVAMRTNSHGWRDDEVSITKPPGTVRVLGLGDSVMFGWAVDRKARYTDRLEALLAEHYPEVDWQVLTMACPGYNLVMEVEALERYGLAYEPDVLLYGFVANDTCLPNFVAAEPDLLGRRSFLLDLLRHLDLPSPGLIDRHDAVRGETPLPGFSLRYCSPDSVQPRYRELAGQQAFDNALERLRDLGAERDVPVVFISHPLRDGMPRPEVPEGVFQVSALEHMGANGSHDLPPDLRAGPNDPHPNAVAHDRIARTIFETLDAQGLWQRWATGGDHGGGSDATSSR